MTWGEQNTQDEGFRTNGLCFRSRNVNFWDTAELIFCATKRKKLLATLKIIIGNWFNSKIPKKRQGYT